MKLLFTISCKSKNSIPAEGTWSINSSGGLQKAAAGPSNGSPTKLSMTPVWPDSLPGAVTKHIDS